MASLARQTVDDALRIEEDSRLVVQQSGHPLPLPTPSASQRRIDGDDESQDVDGVVSQEVEDSRISPTEPEVADGQSMDHPLSTDAPEVSLDISPRALPSGPRNEHLPP